MFRPLTKSVFLSLVVKTFSIPKQNILSAWIHFVFCMILVRFQIACASSSWICCAIHEFDAWGTIYGKILDSDNKRNFKKIPFPAYTPRPPESIRNMHRCPFQRNLIFVENKQIFDSFLDEKLYFMCISYFIDDNFL